MKLLLFALGFSLLPAVLFGDTRISKNQLPAAVQTAMKAQTTGSHILGYSKETEGGRTTYEVETRRNGKGRDLSFDADGHLLETEQQVQMSDVPGPARHALEQRARGGEITKVESVTAGNSVSYEATVAMKNGRKTEVAVNADGTPHKGD